MSAASATLPKTSTIKVMPGRLHIDKAYQRTVRKARVSSIVKNYNQAAFGCLLVGRRESGKLFVVDGQQRLAAAKKLGIKQVICSVFESEGRGHEAEVFKIVNNDRTGIPSLLVFRACLYSGDKDTLAIKSIVEECGFEVPMGGNRNWPNVACTGALYRIYRRKSGGALLGDTLTIIKRSWPRKKQVLQSFVVGGLSTFLARTPEASHERLVHLLKQQDPIELIGNVNSARKLIGGSRDNVLAHGILKLYNKHLKRKIRWPEE